MSLGLKVRVGLVDHSNASAGLRRKVRLDVLAHDLEGFILRLAVPATQIGGLGRERRHVLLQRLPVLLAVFRFEYGRNGVDLVVDAYGRRRGTLRMQLARRAPQPVQPARVAVVQREGLRVQIVAHGRI